MAKARKIVEDEGAVYPHPRSRAELFGHNSAENLFLQAHKAGRLHHAWLIGGPLGIGKATFAYRVARYILMQQSEETGGEQGLFVDPEEKVFHQISNNAHPDCHTVELQNDGLKIKKTIGIETVRNLIQMMQNTSASGGWRIAVIDSVDDLNGNAANALLKLLEEPPPHCLFLLISHQLGQLLPTLRSRCQKIQLSPLNDMDLRNAVLTVAPDSRLDDTAIKMAEGSVRVALDYLGNEGLETREQLHGLLSASRMDIKRLHHFADTVMRKGEAAFNTTVDELLHFCKKNTATENCLDKRFAEYASGFQTSARQLSMYNLDKKSFLVTELLHLSHLMRHSELVE